MQNENYLIGRQPILNRNEETFAYELLFRSADSLESATVTNASHATANVIINALSGFGLEHILGPHQGFINLELDLLMGDYLNILPRERVVLELLETLKVTPELIERCRVLKEEGFCLALDDHEYHTDYHELYKLVDIVKIDLLKTPMHQLPEMIEKLRPFSVKLLSEKVETWDEFQHCRDLGFDYFQGYYFARPSLIEKKRVDESATTMLKLMRLLMDDAEVEAIEQAFRSSPGLTYKLLLLVNSVSLGVREKIHNVRHAVAILGRQQIKRWIQLTLFASNDMRGPENPLVDMAAVRAAFMEQMAIRLPQLKGSQDAADQAFMTGTLSLLESIYHITIEEVLANLNLSEEVREALSSRSGIYGKLLELAELVEQMDFKDAIEQFEELGLSQEDVLAAQVKAYSWRGGLV
ncbi:MAG TPA: HDOD domain-containing protein [Desulfuromonadaceae bacterium]|jgi:EAL and modified HD-GYP domain-containing signal transduction protein